jgi:hypothetical protein
MVGECPDYLWDHQKRLVAVVNQSLVNESPHFLGLSHVFQRMFLKMGYPIDGWFMENPSTG